MILDGVSVTLGGRRVLEDIDLRIDPGELIGLLGPNGAGKTTLLRAILGLVEHDGTVTVDGRPGYVPQRHEFAWDFPISVAGAVMTARTRQIGWLRRPRQRDKRAVADAIAQVSMTDLRARPIGQLSGGQRQRVLVARALATRPRALLLDEPFTGIDAPTQELLSALLRLLTAQGVAVLLTTHDLQSAAELCTRVCLLNRTIVADGPPETLDEPATWLHAWTG